MDIETYQEELRQVQAALDLDPENADLKKLETDLKDIIDLSTEIAPAKAADPSANRAWKIGDTCEAKFNDGIFYKATITSVANDAFGVLFLEYGNSEVVSRAALREIPEERANRKRSSAPDAGQGNETVKEKTREEKEAERERKRAKREKKKEKLEAKDKEATSTQNSWKKFNTGRSSKSKTGFMKGKAKASIFASPDSVDGKVGVGTCGIGGKGMTDFTKRDKHNYEADA